MMQVASATFLNQKLTHSGGGFSTRQDKAENESYENKGVF